MRTRRRMRWLSWLIRGDKFLEMDPRNGFSGFNRSATMSKRRARTWLGWRIGFIVCRNGQLGNLVIIKSIYDLLPLINTHHISPLRNLIRPLRLDI